MKYLLTLFLLLQMSSSLNAHWVDEPSAVDKVSINVTEWCSLSDEYIKWIDYSRKINQKREKHFHKCILKHSKNESTIPFSQIKESCQYFANEKYKKTQRQPSSDWTHDITGETVPQIARYSICHEH